jgi:hypothetical protein
MALVVVLKPQLVVVLLVRSLARLVDWLALLAMLVLLALLMLVFSELVHLHQP